MERMSRCLSINRLLSGHVSQPRGEATAESSSTPLQRDLTSELEQEKLPFFSCLKNPRIGFPGTGAVKSAGVASSP